jgi:hypothetical protein
MRNHFDPEFSHQASMKMLPGFSKAIDQWVESLPKDPIGGCKAPGGF